MSCSFSCSFSWFNSRSRINEQDALDFCTTVQNLMLFYFHCIPSIQLYKTDGEAVIIDWSKLYSLFSKVVDAPKLAISVLVAILLVSNGLGIGIGIAIGLAFYNIPHNISIILIFFFNFVERLILYFLLLITTLLNFILSIINRAQIDNTWLHQLIQNS